MPELISTARTLSRLGPRKLALYATHRLCLLTGWYRRRTPIHELGTVPSAVTTSARSPFRAPDRSRSVELRVDLAAVTAAADRIAAGEFLYFSNQWLRRPSSWRAWPDGREIDGKHWSDVRVPADGDVKWVWEPSRFDWLYTLGRAWCWSGDEKYLACAVDLVDDWMTNNPPNSGVNWICAQECSIRLFAVVWFIGVTEGVLTSSATQRLWSLVVELSQRVAVSTAYSRAQGNNHAIAEATALYLAGTSLPAHPSAADWKSRGKAMFEKCVLEQFSGDGAYVLHSFNYHREALRNCLIVLTAARVAGDVLPKAVLHRLSEAATFLQEVMDPPTGRVPNYGPNDGSNYMSLSASPYTDFRPITQTVSAALGIAVPFTPGEHDEELAFFDVDAVRAHRPPASFAAPEGGYYVVRRPHTWAMLRCHTFRSRPSHSDMLHFDFWADGVNLLCDSGTFQYAGVGGATRYFESTSAHNTVVVNDRDPMTKISRFLWADWTKARLLRNALVDSVQAWSGEHYGYRKAAGVVHRRTVLVCGDDWLVIDDLISNGKPFDASLRWHLAAEGQWDFEGASALSRRTGVRLTTDLPSAVFPADVSLIQTARSEYYGDLSPVHLVEVRFRGTASVRRFTAIGSAGLDVQDRHVIWRGMDVPRSVSD